MSSRSFARSVLIITVLLPGLNSGGFAQPNNHFGDVNPFIGTAKSNVLTRWGNEGGTFPGAVAPSGAVQLSPETRLEGSKGYDYTDSVIYYFSCFGHFSGFPGGSAGQFLVMPVSASANFEKGNYGRHFSHQNESAYPGYYKVVFTDDHTIAEATAGTRTGMFRFTFDLGISPQIFIGDAGEFTPKTKKILNFARGNTVVNFNEDYGNVKKMTGGWLFTFNSCGNGKKTISLQISRSSVNFAGAQNNIDQEIGFPDFDKVRKHTQEEWAKKLAVIDVTDGNQQNKAIFYTALYHALLLPWVIDDADGRYTGADGKVYQKSGGAQYGGFSPWDTFRSLNPMLTLLYPGKENDIVLSMLDVYKQTGHLPTESMTGNHAIPIIVDTYLKGITGFDKILAYKAMKSNILDRPFVQKDMETYHKNGYVPFTNSESVTRTVEYAYDDWALAQYAEKAIQNKPDYKTLIDRSYSYRNLLNPGTLFLLPRNKDEFKLKPGTSGYKEGDQWVYSYFVPHNTKDLVNLLGGNDQFAARLDSALENKVILFDNETVFHLPYLFNQAGKPDLTQKWCRQIMLDRFSASPGGLPGNDDLGSTSSWYVFSALGIYPVCPGRPLYAVGSPLFQSVTLHLPDGKKFIINSENSSETAAYVKSLSINGKPWQHLLIPHSVLVNGGLMTFSLATKPGKWAAGSNPIELSETKAPAIFKVANCRAAVNTVNPDQPFYIRYSITNNGSLGVKTVCLLVNGKFYGYKNSLVASGQLAHDSIECRLYSFGKSRLHIPGSAPFFVNVVRPKTTVAHPYRITGLSAKPIIRKYENQQIIYTVQNIGGLKRVFQIPVTINDSVIFTDKLSLYPGEKKEIRHVVSAPENGLQQVTVGSARFVFKVYQANKESLLLDLPIAESGEDNLIEDKSGFKNNGHLMPAEADHANTPAGKLLFGENCFLEMPDAASLKITGETLTMMAWVYPTGKENGLTDIFTQGDTNVLQVTDGKTLTFFAGGWGRGDCTVNLPADWRQHWHHISGICAGKTLSVYIDGKLAGRSLTDVSASLEVNNKWVLGRNEEFPSERIFHGYMKKVKIFEQALTGEEVLSIVLKEK
ncbi:MAG: GH92 family glycosyl hydrolase [Bacteroidota bacterium]|nr:GH92 family glycosyl hydrolase [Bacteroidota bacterium]